MHATGTTARTSLTNAGSWVVRRQRVHGRKCRKMCAGQNVHARPERGRWTGGRGALVVAPPAPPRRH
eukprot:scaffold38343_cov63-Phaeocystis_antarctica.AAC.2